RCVWPRRAWTPVRSSIGCSQRPGAAAHRAINAVAGALRIQLLPGGIRSRHRRAEHLPRNVRQPRAARDENKNLLHRQRRGRGRKTEGTVRRRHFDQVAKGKLEINISCSESAYVLEHAATSLNVMLSEALARPYLYTKAGNISDCSLRAPQEVIRDPSLRSG